MPVPGNRNGPLESNYQNFILDPFGGRRPVNTPQQATQVSFDLHSMILFSKYMNFLVEY